jgi:hypothetical protein
VVLALAVAAALPAFAARAAEAPARAVLPIDIRWSAPAGCPSVDEMTDRIRAMLRPAPAAGGARRYQVQARIEIAGPGEWRALIAIAGPSSPTERAFRGQSCEAVTNATALVLAFLIDPTAVSVAAAPASVVEEAAGSRRAAIANAGAVHAEPTPSPPPPPRWTARAEAGGDAGSLPAATWGVAVALGLRLGHARAELSAAHWVAQRRTLALRDPAPGGSFDLNAGGVAGCYEAAVAALGPLAPGACVGLEAGGLRGTGFSVTSPGQATGLWLAADVAGTLTWRLSATVGLSLRLALVTPLRRPTYEIEGIGPTYRTSSAAGRIMAGVEAHF